MASHDSLGGPAAACPGTGRQCTNVGLEQLRRALCIFATERAWTEHHTPSNLLLALVKEVGELSRIFQWRGELPAGLARSLPHDEQLRLAQALADVLLHLLRLADVCGVDLGRAALQKLAHNSAKYPKQQQQQQQQSVRLNTYSDNSASSAVSSCSTNVSMPLHQHPQQHILSPSYVAGQVSSDAASPGKTQQQQQQQPSAADFISNLPASPRQLQVLLQPAGLLCGSPNLAEGIQGYECASRSSRPMLAAAMGSPPQQLSPQQLSPQQLSPIQLSPQQLSPQQLSPQQLSPRSLAGMMHSATAATQGSTQMPTQVQAKQQQQQQQQLELQGVTVSTGSACSWLPLTSSSRGNAAPADDGTALHSSKAAGLLPQGLLDDIGHCLQLGPAAAAADDSAGEGDRIAGFTGLHHSRVVSIGECITPPLDFSPCMSRNNSAAAPLSPPSAGPSRSGSLSLSSSAGNSSNIRTYAAADAAVSAAAAAASAAASGSAAASLWLTAEAGAAALSAGLASQQGSAATLMSCGTSQLSWGIFSASSAEQSGAVSSLGDDSELGSEQSGTALHGGINTTSSNTGLVHEHTMQQLNLHATARTGSGGLPPALGFADLIDSPQQQYLQHQQQQHLTIGSSCSGSIGGIPMCSLAAAAAAAAAASGIAPVDVDAASAVQQLAAGLLDVGGFELCPRCGRLHSGACDAVRRAKCPRCYRKAHLGECWSRCISCNLVHAAGKCRAGSSSSVLCRGRRDQQQLVQQQQQSSTAAAAAAVDEDLESFPSLSEGMAGSGAPAAAAATAVAAAQPAPAGVQLDFSPRMGR